MYLPLYTNNICLLFCVYLSEYSHISEIKVFRTKVVEKIETHFMSGVISAYILRFPIQLNEKNIVSTYSNLHIQESTMISHTLSQLGNKQENKGFVDFRLCCNQICFIFKLVMYYDVNLKHIVTCTRIYDRCQATVLGQQSTVETLVNNRC
jgi:hypothetical protein